MMNLLYNGIKIVNKGLSSSIGKEENIQELCMLQELCKNKIK